MKKRIEGIVPPVVTPLKTDGTLDRGALCRHHEYLIKNRVAGLFVLGTTGEGPALPQKIKEETIVRTVENCNRRVPVLVGISADNLQDYLDLADFAARSGADGVVAAPPCYLPLENRELLEFYRILGAEQPLPVYVYNMPAMTKILMPPELVVEILQLPGIAGYKDSAGSAADFEKVASEMRDRREISLFMGPDTLLQGALRAGACGGVNSGANLAPQFYVGMYEACRKGDEAAAEKYQRWIVDLQKVYQFRENICCGVAAGLKYALSRLGFMEPFMTRPARPIDGEPVIDDFVKRFSAEFKI
ncbi:MAG: dihydrodipicolinate synthase family protein [Lentisphaeria bacterium]|nr:dihydrodipicolinate synthase family protein [Lentisphaeria bacterium]